MNRLPPPFATQRLRHGRLLNAMMKNCALRRSINRQYVSCLAGSSPCSTQTQSEKRSFGFGAAPALPSCASTRSSMRRHSKIPSCNYYNKTDERYFPTSSSRRLFSTAVSSSASARSAIENTPLDGPKGAALLRGLDIHTVPAEDDDHPLAVYTIKNQDGENNKNEQPRIPVLLLHGRTWSSVPVYHLLGGSNNDNESSNANADGGGENRSLIQALYDTHNIQPYAMDFRGFGGTPKDESGFVEPLKCVSDVVSVLNWIQEKHNNDNGVDEGGDHDGVCDSSRPALLGWSHGALIAQITAQRHSDKLSKLILYGSTYNPNVKYSIPPPSDINRLLHKGQTDLDDFPVHQMTSRNEYHGAMEDFTNYSNTEARIFPPVSAKLFAEAALVSDPMKVQWWNLHQLNECHPSLVKVPTIVIAGDQDPYAPMQTQAELFTNLGRGVDRVWSIIANSDHAVHLSDERNRFVENVDNFLQSC